MYRFVVTANVCDGVSDDVNMFLKFGSSEIMLKYTQTCES